MLKQPRALLKKYYGFSDFKAGQAQIITSILQGKDTLAIIPTGAGKSLCFQIPALIFEGVTLVISPLIALMKDQVDALGALGVAATFINSPLHGHEVDRRINAAVRGEYKLLYVAPERLESEWCRQLLQNLQISLVAIDEAHCVSQWGHDFRPSYRNITPFIDELPHRPIIGAFTATATEDVQSDIIGLLSLVKPSVFVTGFDRPNLSFTVLRGENKRDFVLKYVADNQDKSGIVYAGTRKEVDHLHDLLHSKRYSCGKYHAGMDDAVCNPLQHAKEHGGILPGSRAGRTGWGTQRMRFAVFGPGYCFAKVSDRAKRIVRRAKKRGNCSNCNEQQMRSIRGIGEIKLAHYGAEFLREIERYIAEHDEKNKINKNWHK